MGNILGDFSQTHLVTLTRVQTPNNLWGLNANVNGERKSVLGAHLSGRRAVTKIWLEIQMGKLEYFLFLSQTTRINGFPIKKKIVICSITSYFYFLLIHKRREKETHIYYQWFTDSRVLGNVQWLLRAWASFCSFTASIKRTAF
jgi:hypothetical protein